MSYLNVDFNLGLNLSQVFSCLDQVCPESFSEECKNKPFPHFSIDTRCILPSHHTIFVAIKGTKTDGHDHILDAVKNGAIGAVISRTAVFSKDLLENLPKAFFLIAVDHTEQALIKLATWYRQQFTLPVIGITGSCGKTTVKEMTAKILEQVGPTLKTQGNYNNEIGLPLTLLNLKPHHQFAVVELGARHTGDIAVLSDIAKPTVSVVTLVAPVHLEIFKTIENIAQTKGEIYHGLPKTGVAVVNRDEPYSDYFIHSCINAKLATFSLSANLSTGTDYFATDIHLFPEKVEWVLHTPFGHTQIKVPLPGMHTISNALAAASIAGSLGVSLEKIRTGLAHFSTITGRMQIKQDNVTGAVIIDDTYNANPRSLTAAMEVLSTYSGKKCLILGDMGELGETAAQLHFDMGEKAKKLAIDYLFTVGKLSEQASKAFGVGAMHAGDQLGLIEAVKKILDKNCTVLVKGSRSAKMEKVVNGLITANNN